MAAPLEFRPLTLAQAQSEYMRHLDRRVAGGTLSATTRATYTRDLTDHVAIVGAGRMLDDVDTGELDDAVLAWSQGTDRRKTKTPGGSRSTNTLTRHVANIRAFYGWAEGQGLLRRNPTVGMAVSPRPVKPDKRRQALDNKQAGSLSPIERSGPQAAILKARDGVLLGLLLETGVRVSELCALDRGDIGRRKDGWWVQVRSGKGNKPRAVPVASLLAADIEGYLALRGDGSPALLVSATGRRLTARAVQQIVDKSARVAGLSTTPHALRHTLGQGLVVDRGIDVAVVANILGHASPATTAKHYLDDVSPAMRDAIGD